MAEELDKLINFFKNLGPKEITQTFDALENKAEKSIQGLGKLKNKANEVKEEIKDLGTTALRSFQSFQDLDNLSLNNLVSNLSKSNRELTNVGSQIGLISLSLRSGFKPEAFITLGDAARETTGDISETLETINKLIGINPSKDDPLSKTLRTIENLIQLGDPTKQLEMGLITTAASSGQLGDLLENVGEDLSGLSLKAESFSRITYELANVSGLSQKQVAGFARQLMTIPGAMDTSIESFEKGVDDIHLLDATMKVATGTGVGFSKTIEDLSFQYNELGITGKRALEYTAKLADVSQNLRLPMENIRNYTESTAKSFRYLGDNTQSALNVFERFAPALQKGGLGARAISDLIGGVTQSISQMGLAQKAFLSAQTGGPGGLQGGYQIDLLMKQGKMDEVYKKVESSLRQQFGGRIVSLEEAAKDSRAAGQFTKQVQLLTQGPTKIAGSEQEAYRILDVLSKGMIGKETGKSPEQAFQSALQTGDKLQERSANSLSKIQNEVERTTQLASISAYNLTRLVAGTEGRDLRSVIQESRTKSSEMLGSTGKLITGEGYLEGGQKINEVVEDFWADFGSNTRGAKNMMGGFFSNFTSATSEEGKKILPDSIVQQLNNFKQGSILPGQQPQQTEKMDITVQAVCPQCNVVSARTEATKVGKKLIDQKETNKAIALHTGVEHGL